MIEGLIYKLFPKLWEKYQEKQSAKQYMKGPGNKTVSYKEMHAVNQAKILRALREQGGKNPGNGPIDPGSNG